MKRFFAACALSLLVLALQPADGIADAPRKAKIHHNGQTIEVSCHALNGHRQHADKSELFSILKATIRCKKIRHGG